MTHSLIEVYEDDDGFCWRFVGDKVLCWSAESYDNRDDAHRGFNAVLDELAMGEWTVVDV